MNTKRYQVIAYSDILKNNEKIECTSIIEAFKKARRYMRNEYYSGVLVYDLKTKGIKSIYGQIPQSAIPA